MRSTLSDSMISDARKPPDACHAMWQWKAQMPVVVMLVSISLHLKEKGGEGGGGHTRRAVDLDHEMAVATHEVDVSSMRVRRADDGAVPGSGAFVQDEEIVPVEVHGMTTCEVLVSMIPLTKGMEGLWGTRTHGTGPLLLTMIRMDVCWW